MDEFDNILNVSLEAHLRLLVLVGFLLALSLGFPQFSELSSSYSLSHMLWLLRRSRLFVILVSEDYKSFAEADVILGA